MSTVVITSIILITLALIFYSLGVWSERIVRYLKPWHVVAIWVGFTFDISGTYAMYLLAKGPFDITEPHINRADCPLADVSPCYTGNKSSYKE